MATSAHAYARGSTTRFHQWLEASNGAALPEGPQAWICGDCHVSNLGPMLAGRMLDKAVFIRELLPQDLLEIENLSREEAMSVSRYLAHVVGRGHARQMDSADCRQWLAELQRNRSKSLDAPSWLWNRVADSVASHEAAYLNHCRRYAIADAA